MNLYDVLAGQGTTHFERLFSQRFAGGAVQTLTGIPPLSFKANGKPLISWSMKGNGQQTGTPSPDNIIMPTFCGVRTAQLFEGAFGGSIGTTGGIAYNEQYEVYYAKVEAGLTYTISGGYYVYAYYSDIPSVGTGNSVDNTRHFTSQGNVITVIDGASWIGVRVNLGDKPMLNLGSTALPYEPYGWAEKITCAGQTTPVYLGQVSTVRRVRKLVLDGTESWAPETTNVFTMYTTMPKEGYKDLICTHYGLAASYSDLTSKNNVCAVSKRPALFIKDSRFTTSADFKAYLAAQYANGTPVTVWYVLAEPTTGIVNEPLCKIGDYADELHSEDAGVSIPTVNGSNTLTVETELQPSSMTITYKS